MRAEPCHFHWHGRFHVSLVSAMHGLAVYLNGSCCPQYVSLVISQSIAFFVVPPTSFQSTYMVRAGQNLFLWWSPESNLLCGLSHLSFQSTSMVRAVHNLFLSKNLLCGLSHLVPIHLNGLSTIYFVACSTANRALFVVSQLVPIYLNGLCCPQYISLVIFLI